MHPSDNATDDLPGVTRRPSPVWTVAVNSAVTRTDAAKPQVRRELLGEQQVLRKLRPTACRAGHAVGRNFLKTCCSPKSSLLTCGFAASVLVTALLTATVHTGEGRRVTPGRSSVALSDGCMFGPSRHDGHGQA